MVKRNQESDNEHEDRSPNKRHRIEDEEDGDDLTKKKINKPGKAAECGIIKKIYVEEFMCHKKLSINLCDNVNFVHGQNGSGKSAILAALQICLGAKANRTHRARNLKDLVRKEDGATQARVRVTLLNCGPDAFQHDIYGDEITIERLISLAGSGGGYKLLDRSLKCRSTKKGDLTDLLDQLNIQVDNPVAILDQEEAKKFLTGKAEDKYNFFLKATDLERIDVKYSETGEHVQELQESILAMQKKLQPLQSQVDLLQKEWEAFEALEKLESKEAELTLKYAWSFYSQCLESYNGQKNEVDSIQNQVNALREKLNAEEAKVVNDEEKDVLTKKLEELTTEANEAANTKQELVRERHNLLAPMKKHEQEIKRKQQEVRNSKRKVDLAKRELQNKRDEIMRIQGSANDEEAQRQARMKKAEEDMERAKRTIEEAAVEVNHSLSKYEEGKTRESALENQVNKCKGQCNAVNSKIRDLKASQGNSLAVFGSKCESMSAAIEQARRAGKFQGKVVGPIGKYMKIISGKEHFAGLAEHALGMGLDRFLVTNSHDRDIVLQIRDQVRCRPRECLLFQMTDGPRYNIRLPPEGINVVASVLTATDDLVFNCMVDNGRMDQKALFETMDESTKALQSVDANGKYHMKVQNIKTVFWLPRGDTWQLHNFMPTITSSNKQVKSPTVGIDKTRAIKEAQNDLAQLQRETEQKSSELHALKKERHQYKVQWNDSKKKSASAKKKINDLTNLIEQIKEEAENAENQTFDTSDLEDDVQLAQDEYEKLRSEEDELKMKLETFQPGIDEATARVEENEARNEKIAKDMEDTEKQLEKCLQSEEKQKRHIAKRKKKVEEGEIILEKQKDELAEKEKSMNDTLHKAKMLTVRHHRVCRNKEIRAEHKKNGGEYEMDLVDEEGCTEEELQECEPMIMNKSPELYAEKIRQIKKKIERERLNRNILESNPEVAFEKYIRAKKHFEKQVNDLHKTEANVDMLIIDMRDRKRKWKAFREHIVANSNHTFDEVLQRKGSSGKIEYDHKAQTLDICVRKDMNDTTETRDVKALSGGERSFTTLALLIALGENLETPFRVMDEFDVFLDPVARKIALKTMIEVATSFENRQFIFITPQDLSNIKTTPKLRMFHLEPPKRNARVGGPVQTTLG